MKSVLAKIAFAALLVASASCSITTRTPETPDLASVPDVLHYEVVSYPMVDRTTFDLKDGWIVKRFSRWDRRTVTLARRRPSPADWVDFNRFLARSRVWEWEVSYRRNTSVFDQVCDGESWALSLHENQHLVESHARNVYPRLREPKRATNDRESLDRLTAALERLAGASNANRKTESEQIADGNRH